MTLKISRRAALVLASGTALLGRRARAESKYSTGATDTEIKMGQTMPYSGNASA